MTDRIPTRRTFLTLTAGGLAAGFAGCTSGDGAGSTDGGMSTDDGGMAATETDAGGMGTADTESGMNDDDGGMSDDGEMDSTETSTPAAGSTLTLDVDLPELAMGHYEGWAIEDGEKHSTGTFDACDAHSFDLDRDVSGADEIVVTVEPADDSDAAPSGVVVLAGALEDGHADLSFPVAFDDAAGEYILATPTNGGDSDERAGIWWLDPSGPDPGLSLPELPDGWTYEGWVVAGGQPLTTGRFDSPAGADGFDGFSGERAAPPFPGEDFLVRSPWAPDGVSFPLDLTAQFTEAVITVEPDLDGMDPTGPGPSGIGVLTDEIPRDASPMTTYEMRRSEGAIPTGTATVE